MIKSISLFSFLLCFCLGLRAQYISFRLEYQPFELLPDSSSQQRMWQVCAKLKEGFYYDLEIKSYTADHSDEQDNQRLLEQRLQLILERLEQQAARLENIKSSHQLNGSDKKSYVKLVIQLNKIPTPKPPKGGKKTKEQPSDPQIQQQALAWIEEQQSQIFRFQSDSAQLLVGKEGSQILVPARAFYYPNGQPAQGQIQLRLLEANLPSSRILLAAPTMSNGRAIQTGGSLLLTAQDSAGNQLNSDRIRVSFPDDRQWLPNMQIYTAQRQNGQALNWQSSGRPIQKDEKRRPLNPIFAQELVAENYRLLDSCINANKGLFERLHSHKQTFNELQAICDRNGMPKKSKHTNAKFSENYQQNVDKIRQLLTTEKNLEQLPAIFLRLQDYNQSLDWCSALCQQQANQAIWEINKISPLFFDSSLANWERIKDELAIAKAELSGYSSTGEHYSDPPSPFWERLKTLQDFEKKYQPTAKPSRTEGQRLAAVLGKTHQDKTSLFRLFVDLQHIPNKQKVLQKGFDRLQNCLTLIKNAQESIDEKRRALQIIGQNRSELLLQLQAAEDISQVLPASAPIQMGQWINCDQILATGTATMAELRPLRLKIDDKRINPNECLLFLELSNLDVTLQLTKTEPNGWETIPIDNRRCDLHILQFLPEGKVLAYRQKGSRKQLQKAKISFQELKIADLPDFLRQQ